jgi:hypothetical protein
MLSPLRDHIVSPETRIQSHRDTLTLPDLKSDDRARTEADLKIAELALQHYLQAYELAQKPKSA